MELALDWCRKTSPMSLDKEMQGLYKKTSEKYLRVSTKCWCVVLLPQPGEVRRFCIDAVKNDIVQLRQGRANRSRLAGGLNFLRGLPFQVARGFMEKLEQVSEDPTLKEEMEKEVHSTSAQVSF